MTPNLLLLFIAVTEAYNPTWTRLKSDDGWVVQDTIQTSIGAVVVSKKMVDGFPCFKGETEYDGVLDIPLMIEAAADAESAMEWSSAGVTEAETLAPYNKTTPTIISTSICHFHCPIDFGCCVDILSKKVQSTIFAGSPW